MRTEPIALTDRQFELLKTAMKSVSPRQRKDFGEHVAAHLSARPTDLAVEAAIASQLAENRHYFWDSVPNKENK